MTDAAFSILTLLLWAALYVIAVIGVLIFLCSPGKSEVRVSAFGVNVRLSRDGGLKPNLKRSTSSPREANT